MSAAKELSCSYERLIAFSPKLPHDRRADVSNLGSLGNGPLQQGNKTYSTPLQLVSELSLRTSGARLRVHQSFDLEYREVLPSPYFRVLFTRMSALAHFSIERRDHTLEPCSATKRDDGANV